MSAYASLPGSFLPPFFAFSSLSTTLASSHLDDKGAPNNAKAASSVTNAASGNGDSRDTHTESAQPKQHTLSASSSCPAFSQPELKNSMFKSPAISFASNFQKPESSEPSKTRSTNPPSPSPASEIIIAIQSARVDPVQLIQSLTSRGSNIARRTANFIARTPSAVGEKETQNEKSNAKADAENDEVSTNITRTNSNSSLKPSLCYEDTDSDEDEEMSFYDYDDDFSNHDEDDHEDFQKTQNDNMNSNQNEDPDKGDATAIQFELAINFQGRKYTATRAFSTFVKLRNDLLHEMNLYGGDEMDGKNGTHPLHKHKRRPWERCRSHSSDSLKRDEQEFEKKTNDFMFKIEDLAQFQSDQGKESGELSVSIPALPTVSPENYGGPNGSSSNNAWSGVACRGFAYLQATAKLYCPEMEQWLRHVIDAVPSSPSLSRFLWEPLASSSASWDTNEQEESSKSATDEDDDTASELVPPFKNTSSFAKPPLTQRKSRSTNTSKGKRFISKGSLGSLNSIHEGDDDKCEEDF